MKAKQPLGWNDEALHYRVDQGHTRPRQRSPEVRNVLLKDDPVETRRSKSRLILALLTGFTATGIGHMFQSSQPKPFQQPAIPPVTDPFQDAAALRITRTVSKIELREHLLLRATPSVHRQIEASPASLTTNAFLEWPTENVQALRIQIIDELSSAQDIAVEQSYLSSSSRLRQPIDAQRREEQLHTVLFELLKRLDTALKVQEQTRTIQLGAE